MCLGEVHTLKDVQHWVYTVPPKSPALSIAKSAIAQLSGYNFTLPIKHLDMIVGRGLLHKTRMGRENYYVNTALVNVFMSKNS